MFLGTSWFTQAESTLDLLPPQARADAVVTGNPMRAEVLAGDANKAAVALGWTGLAPGCRWCT